MYYWVGSKSAITSVSTSTIKATVHNVTQSVELLMASANLLDKQRKAKVRAAPCFTPL